MNKRTLKNAILRLATQPQVKFHNVQKVVKIRNFAKDSGNEKFLIFDKILTQPQTSRNPSNEQENTLECHSEACNSFISQI